VLYNLFNDFLGFTTGKVDFTEYLKGFAKFFLVSLGGTSIGIVFGFLTSFVTRFTNYARDIEIIYIFVMSYLSYLCADLVNWSGILALIFCAMIMKSYVNANISPKSLTSIKYDMKSLGNTSEAVVFLFLGVNACHHQYTLEASFILVTILSCLVVRTIGVIVLSTIVNRFRLYKLDLVEIFVLSFGGLRGAVAYALVEALDNEKVDNAGLFKTTTLIVIFFTVFVQGITIKPLVKYLEVKQSASGKKTMNEQVHEILMDYISVGIEDVLGHVGYFKLLDKFKQVNNRFIRPFLVRDQQAQEPKILETYSKLATKDALKLMNQNSSTLHLVGTESMDVFFRNFLAKAKMRHLRPSEPRNRFRLNWSPEGQLLVSDPPFRNKTPVHIRRTSSESVVDSEEEVSKISNGLVKDSCYELKSSAGCEPKAVEKRLSWRRRDDTPAVRSECTPWAEKDYVCYYPPTNTFLDASNSEQPLPSVVDCFNQPSGDDYEQLSTCSCSIANSRSSSVVLCITDVDSVSAKND
jgi:NhaP-type Na+/H+ or K+/H+ antiporter